MMTKGTLGVVSKNRPTRFDTSLDAPARLRIFGDSSLARRIGMVLRRSPAYLIATAIRILSFLSVSRQSSADSQSGLVFELSADSVSSMSAPAPQYSCPHCQGVFQTAVSQQPQTVACPHCGQHTTIAAATADAGARGATPESALASRRRQRRPVQSTGWLLLLGCLVVVVALLVFLGGKLLSALNNKSSQAASGEALNSEDNEYELANDDQLWTDASKRSQLLEGYLVKVIRAELGDVRGRDSSNTVQTLEKDGLQIGLEIRNAERESTRRYQSWYAASREDAAHAQLRDDLGNIYPLLYFADVHELQGHTAEAELVFGQRVRDVLIFEVPKGVDRNRVTYFHLRLEAAPLGRRGRFQFLIPISMVHNWQ
jgi:hypothetical protein